MSTFRPQRRAEAVKKQTDQRRALDYAMRELELQCALVEELAPATDNYEYAMWQVRALRSAIAVLRKPCFPVNPLV